MSSITNLIDAYRRELSLTWHDDISGAEKIWMLLYSPNLERQVRSATPRFAAATKEAGRSWGEIDISDEFGKWVASHKHSKKFLSGKIPFSSAIVGEFERVLTELISAQVNGYPEGSVVAIVGIGSLFPYVRAHNIIGKIESGIGNRRILIFFPGSHDSAHHVFRLLNARDGFDYRAVVIDTSKELL